MNTIKKEQLLNTRNLALEAFDAIHSAADAAGSQARYDAEWRNRNYNDSDMMEDEYAAYSTAFNAEFERLGGKQAEAELDAAANALEAIWQEESLPRLEKTVRNLRNPIILDDE